MTSNTAITIVPATASDAPAIAELIDIAGEGLPREIWRHYAPPGQEPLAFGAERAAIGGGNFSWRNAHLAVADGAVSGMLLAYRLPDAAPDFSDLHPLEYPLVRLEAQAPGSFYINAIAVYPHAQRRGYGRHLMSKAHELTTRAGCDQSSLIVFANNHGARALYRSLDYVERASQPPIEHPAFRALGECLLLVRDAR